MTILVKAKSAARVLVDRCKEALFPSYRPELHYMRGPGPASDRRDRPAS